LLFYRYEGKRGLPKTQKPILEAIRGIFLFLSYTTFMMGLAALPLADVESIKFSGPLMITFFSVLILGERVGPRRWLALIVGFFGVLLIIRPGSATFNLGSVFILVSTLLYALVVIITRKLQNTDSSATMAFYSSLVYLVAVVVLAPLPALVGDVPEVHPSIAFLIRPWSMPPPIDLVIMAGLGLVWAGWMYFLARAYSTAQASVIAPFEYISLPINILWGYLIWHEVPTWMTLSGAGLTLFSGLYVLYRERA
jgi:drug/metabolite transporter (DMT)-like permease